VIANLPLALPVNNVAVYDKRLRRDSLTPVPFQVG
jgi:hypothetical protein